MIEQLKKYINEGRKHGAASYSVSAYFLESVLKRMEADELTIENLMDALRVTAPQIDHMNQQNKETES